MFSVYIQCDVHYTPRLVKHDFFHQQEEVLIISDSKSQLHLRNETAESV